MEFEISGRKIANGDVLERARLLFLVNTPAFKILARKQGFEISDLNKLEEVYKGSLTGENKFNFQELFKLIPVSHVNIRAGKGRWKITRN